ncbi:MAG: ubiquinone/menaquinone biosynthesis methyltransferase [Dehalococcoidia bacterium]|nr:ubiquinone/menaquinone biosynthesis methyltransferase [Dehalococcoidia bacterium]
MAHLTGDDKRRYVAEMFARISPRYDLMNSLMTGGMHHRWKRDTARLTAAGAAGTERGGTDGIGATLDIATGTGDLAFALANCAGVTAVVGVDLLSEMLSIAARRRRVGHRPGDTPITFAQADALQLPFADNTFVGATAGFSLRNMPDVPAAINEMARVVAPGGKVTTLELTPMRPGIPAMMGRLYFHRFVPLMGQLVAGDRAAYTYLPDSVDYFLTADGLAEVYRQAGLVNVGYRRLGLGGVALHYGDKPV